MGTAQPVQQRPSPNGNIHGTAKLEVRVGEREVQDLFDLCVALKKADPVGRRLGVFETAVHLS